MGFKFTIYKAKAGFTLIELLVVITISLFIGGAGLFSYVSYADKQIVEQAVLNFKQTVGKAQANASSFVKPEQCTSTTYIVNGVSYPYSVNGFKTVVEVNPNNRTKIYGICIRPISPFDTFDTSVQDQQNYSVNLTLTAGSCTSFFYETLTNKFQCLVGSMSPLPRYQFQKGTASKSIEIQADGHVTIL